MSKSGQFRRDFPAPAFINRGCNGREVVSAALLIHDTERSMIGLEPRTEGMNRKTKHTYRNSTHTHTTHHTPPHHLPPTTPQHPPPHPFSHTATQHAPNIAPLLKQDGHASLARKRRRRCRRRPRPALLPCRLLCAIPSIEHVRGPARMPTAKAFLRAGEEPKRYAIRLPL